jgi:hypothetical protein
VPRPDSVWPAQVHRPSGGHKLRAGAADADVRPVARHFEAMETQLELPARRAIATRISMAP